VSGCPVDTAGHQARLTAPPNHTDYTESDYHFGFRLGVISAEGNAGHDPVLRLVEALTAEHPGWQGWIP
jgi:hypothetical protein